MEHLEEVPYEEFCKFPLAKVGGGAASLHYLGKMYYGAGFTKYLLSFGGKRRSLPLATGVSVVQVVESVYLLAEQIARYARGVNEDAENLVLLLSLLSAGFDKERFIEKYISK